MTLDVMLLTHKMRIPSFNDRVGFPGPFAKAPAESDAQRKNRIISFTMFIDRLSQEFFSAHTQCRVKLSRLSRGQGYATILISVTTATCMFLLKLHELTFNNGLNGVAYC
jgi:hypothetical protein